jgi:thiosulfate dehydrogenase
MKFVLGIIVGFLLMLLFGLAYFRFGFAPVATSAKPMPFEETLAGWALDARLDKEMPKTIPISSDAANLTAGAHIYVEDCAMCHGLPVNRSSPMYKAMFPNPPELFQGEGVTDDPAGATYWVITNGIRMTGMPSFNKMMNETQRWQAALLLANAHKLPAEVSDYLKMSELSK